MRTEFYNYICELQDRLTDALATLDGKAQFQEDIWERPEGGGGRTRIIENGAVFGDFKIKQFINPNILTNYLSGSRTSGTINLCAIASARRLCGN